MILRNNIYKALYDLIDSLGAQSFKYLIDHNFEIQIYLIYKENIYQYCNPFVLDILQGLHNEIDINLVLDQVGYNITEDLYNELNQPETSVTIVLRYKNVSR